MMPVETIVGSCLTCNAVHVESETFILRGLLRCKATHALVDRFAVPALMEQEPAQPVERDAIRGGILDLAFHAGIDLAKNRQSLDEIVSKFCQLLAGSEQQK